MNATIHGKLTNSKRRLERRLDKSDLGDCGRPMFTASNIHYEIVEVDKCPVPDPTKFDAILAMGGFQHVGDNEKYPYLVMVESMICKAVEEDIPYLGICLGGQLLAHALGAPVKRHSITPLGFYKVQKTAEGKTDPLFHGLPDNMQVFHWHEDTFDIPKEAVQLASNWPSDVNFARPFESLT